MNRPIYTHRAWLSDAAAVQAGNRYAGFGRFRDTRGHRGGFRRNGGWRILLSATTGGCEVAERVIIVHSPVTSVVRKESAIAAAKRRMGWKAYVTNAPKTRLVLEEAVLCYRNQFLISEW